MHHPIPAGVSPSSLPSDVFDEALANLEQAVASAFDEAPPPSVEIPISVSFADATFPPADVPVDAPSLVAGAPQLSERTLRRGAVVASGTGLGTIALIAVVAAVITSTTFGILTYVFPDESPTRSAFPTESVVSAPSPTVAPFVPREPIRIAEEASPAVGPSRAVPQPARRSLKARGPVVASHIVANNPY